MEETFALIPCIYLLSLFLSSISCSFLCLCISISVSLRPHHIMTDLLYIKGPCPLRPLPVTSLSMGLYKPLTQGAAGVTTFQRGTVHKHLEGSPVRKPT